MGVILFFLFKKKIIWFLYILYFCCVNEGINFKTYKNNCYKKIVLQDKKKKKENVLSTLDFLIHENIVLFYLLIA